MSTYQQRLNELPKSKVIEIIGGDDGNIRVRAPLPAEYGYTVGSEYSAPFDVSLPSGILQKGMALANISQKIGIRMQNMYSNPVPTEISLDLEFDAYYNARTEVVMPVLNLAHMSLGTALDREYLDQVLGEIKEKLTPAALAAKNAAANATEGVIDNSWLLGNPSSPIPTPAPTPDVTDSTGAEVPTQDVSRKSGEMFNNVMEFIGIIRGPAPQILTMGTFITISDAYLTSISPRFSNVLDKDGFPMSCKCSVTFTLGRYPIAEDVANWHSGGYNNVRWNARSTPDNKG